MTIGRASGAENASATRPANGETIEMATLR